jgi:hypothetical protein
MSAEPLIETTPAYKSIQFLKSKNCCGLRNDSKRIIALIEGLDDLTNFQKITLINRYVTLLEEFSARARTYSMLFHFGRTTVTVGSLLVPALLSIQYTNSLPGSNDQNFSMYIYWVTWVLSLMVTMWNGVLTLFRVDKTYYFIYTTLEHLRSEVMLYIYLSGRYGGHYTGGRKPSHANQYIYICHNLEKIKMKQVDKEYYKMLEQNNEQAKSAQAGENGSQDVAGMFNPTPSTDQLKDHQTQLAQVLAIKSATGVDGQPQKAVPQNTTVQINGKAFKASKNNKDAAKDKDDDEESTSSFFQESEQKVPDRRGG